LLSTAGILYSGFGLESVNRFLEVLLANPAGKWLLSPVVVLGGPVVAAVLNARKIFHLSAGVVNEELVIALSMKRLFANLALLALAGGLIALLLAYAFVENFRIVAR
jgi:hypothetical protein